MPFSSSSLGKRALYGFLAMSVSLMQAPTVFADPLPVNLDLASTHKSVTAPGFSSPVQLAVGNNKLTVAPGTQLTPAQAVAVQQVLSSGLSH